MNALPTLGGPNGFAAGVNKEGRIVGWAENLVVDPSCDPTQLKNYNSAQSFGVPMIINNQVQELLHLRRFRRAPQPQSMMMV